MDFVQTLILMGTLMITIIGSAFATGHIFFRIVRDDIKADRAEAIEFRRSFAKQVAAKEKLWAHLLREIHKIKLDQVRKR